jgi:hypothetical protein
MKCPACFARLTETEVASIKVDVCEGGCGGIWFDGFELQHVDEESETAGESLLYVTHDPAVQVDHSRRRNCPRCEGIKLKRHFFSARRQVEVDQCPNCGGYWLDRGELAHIRAERSADERARQAGQGISIETIRYLYRLRLQAQDNNPSRPPD